MTYLKEVHLCINFPTGVLYSFGSKTSDTFFFSIPSEKIECSYFVFGQICTHFKTAGYPVDMVVTD